MHTGLSKMTYPVSLNEEPVGGRRLALPAPRGPLTEWLFNALSVSPDREIAPPDLLESEDPLADDDFQLALYCCYELHYAAVVGADPRWEWSPSLLKFRAVLEDGMERALANIVPFSTQEDVANVGEALQRIVRHDTGPPISRHLETQGTLDQMLEHVVHRSAYQLKEADPHSWAIPRLTGAPKAALLEIQIDEYGGGHVEQMHAVLFARTMEGLGLDAAYGAYVDLLPGITLATVNLVSLCGLHRRLRGMLVGHLAAFEMTSAVPNRRYGNALRRLGYGAPVTDFYDEHVEADAIHESIAAWDLAAGLAVAEPDVAPDILFGARALMALEARWANHLLTAWDKETTSLTAPLGRNASQ